ncbi:MAG: universal stress protein [Rhodospirillales bacterium]
MLSTTAPRPAPAPSPRPGRESAPVSLARILVALDASDYADRALAESIRLAATADGVITGIHAYAAKLHDRRFRQMEGGLPERYREEKEIEHQRDVHDDLITHGLNIITDSYHDVAERACDDAGRPYRRLSPEGKNYSRIVEAAESGDFDVLALGALGLGAVPGGLIGTVCERVVRRSPIDVLVVRDPARAIGDGPIVVGLDGSSRSFGALRTALDIGRRLGAEVRAVAAYDPYYHYVAFNRISGVLSDEAGKVFRFKEQEKLHEELIDQGIAKIYQSHLEVAHTIARDEGLDLACELLDGKPYRAIAGYVEKAGASLLLIGKTGVHADSALDIGGNAENLLRTAPCHVWLGQAPYTPPLDVVAEETITWSEEAEERMAHVPENVRGMVRMAILRVAQETGHTVVTSALIEEATDRFCPERGGAVEADAAPAWSDGAARLLGTVGDGSVAAGIRLRAEKRARREGAPAVTRDHVRPFLDETEAPAPVWSAAALARLSRVPQMVRGSVRRRAEAGARARGITEITLEVAEAELADARQDMEQDMKNSMDGGGTDRAGASPGGGKKGGGCPFADKHGAGAGANSESDGAAPLRWTPEAEKAMEKVPRGFMRTMARQRIEAFARRHHVDTITPALVVEKYTEWATGSAKQQMTLPWEERARGRIMRIPGFVRGMVILEVERCARGMGKDTVTGEVIERAYGTWETSGAFHSEKTPGLYKGLPKRAK